MALPAHLVVTTEKYDHIVFLPVGKKNKNVRSYGHKHMRGLLSRMNSTIGEILETLSAQEQAAFHSFTGGRLPIPIDREETVYSHLWKPTTFLWSSFNLQTGIPLKKEQFYTAAVTAQSKEELFKHLQRVIQDYVLCGLLAERTQNEFVNMLSHLFQQHPIFQLYETHKNELQSLSILYKAPFFFLLRDQDKVSFWRERREVMMRAFQSIPFSLFEDHLYQQEIDIDVLFPEVIVHFTNEEFSLRYNPYTDTVELMQPIDPDLAARRVQSVIRVFLELWEENSWLLERIDRIYEKKKTVQSHKQTIEWLRSLHGRMQERSIGDYAVPVPKLLQSVDALREVIIPPPHEPSLILRLAGCSFPELSILTKWELFSQELDAELQRLPDLVAQTEQDLQELGEYVLYESLPLPKDDMLALVSFAAATKPAVRSLITSLQGKATRANRLQRYTEFPAFGLLEGWKEPKIIALLQQLQQYNILIKRQGVIDAGKKGLLLLSAMQ